MSACSTLGYYGQAVAGHLRLMSNRQPIEKLLLTADAPLKEQFELALEIRKFAVQELGLPDNKSYLSYVNLPQEYPVWNVVASKELSLTAKQWCYPVIGCASYRGYFAEAKANEHAEELKQENYDVYVAGATAYSTLGWFSDPLIPPMMRYGDAVMAETIFHELAHQELYINDDSEFNEAFATVVGEQGVLRWLRSKNNEGALKRYQKRLEVSEQFYQLLKASKQTLTSVYASTDNDERKRLQKEQAFEQLKLDYQALKESEWQGEAWFDRWFDEPLNNARLVSFSTYQDLVPQIHLLFENCLTDFTQFYRTLEKSSKSKGISRIPAVCI